MKKYDVIILGGGPGGYTAAAELGSQNLKVALIEKDSFGGTCVNYGCIPTKALLSAVKKFNALKHFQDFGIRFNSEAMNVKLNDEGISVDFGSRKFFEPAKVDLKALQNYRKTLRTRLNTSIEKTLKEAKVDIYHGYGEVIDSKSLKVNDEVLEYDKLVLATGSKNRFLDLPNFQKAKDVKILGDSDYFLFLEEVPKSLTIIGGGPISIEFAYLYASLGSEVTILQDMPTIIPQFDKSTIELVHQVLINLGVKIFSEVVVKGLDDNFVLEYEHEKVIKHIKTEKYMLSIGRVLNSEPFDGLNLKKMISIVLF